MTKAPLFLAIALSVGTALCGHVPPTGGSKQFDVTPANLNDHPFGFRVRTGANMIGLPKENTIRFTIEVTERKQPLLPGSHGVLWISDGFETTSDSHFIAGADIAPVRNGKTLKFEFDIARKYLVGYTAFLFVASRKVPFPNDPNYELGDFYNIKLLDFVAK